MSTTETHSGYKVAQHLLVADRDAKTREHIAALLNEKYRVSAVADSGAALDVMKCDVPALLIVDADLLRSGNGSLLSQVKQETALRDMSIIVLKEQSLPDEPELDRVVDDIVRKPIVDGELLARVHASVRLMSLNADITELQRLADLGRLMAQFAHEINNPANVILNNLRPMNDYLIEIAELLNAYKDAEKDLPDGGNVLRRQRENMDLPFVVSDFGDALHAIEQSIERIMAIQSNLRAYVRGEMPELSAGEVNAVVRSAVRSVRAASPRGVAIETEIGTASTSLLNELQLEQVIINLLRNALDAIGERGEIFVTTSQQQRYNVIEVRDTGPGVPGNIQTEIFKPFFTTKPVGLGTGLGLSVCRQIIEHHGGHLLLDLDYAQGAKFLIKIPAYE